MQEKERERRRAEQTAESQRRELDENRRKLRKFAQFHAGLLKEARQVLGKRGEDRKILILSNYSGDGQKESKTSACPRLSLDNEHGQDLAGKDETFILGLVAQLEKLVTP